MKPLSTKEALENPVLAKAIKADDEKRARKGSGVAQARESMLQGVNPAFPLAKAKGRRKKIPGQMTKLEESFSQHLEREREAGRILVWNYEAERLRIAANTTYTPDFAVLNAAHFEEYYEVKGPHVWHAALVKLKVAAAKFWWRTFFLVKREKNGSWKIVEVKAA